MTLGEHDRALLHAIEPWVGVPQDAQEVDRRLSALAAEHPERTHCRARGSRAREAEEEQRVIRIGRAQVEGMGAGPAPRKGVAGFPREAEEEQHPGRLRWTGRSPAESRRVRGWGQTVGRTRQCA